MSWRDLILIVGGFGAGFLSGTIGIGGGALFVPTMTVGAAVPQAIAQGTSLAAIVPTALVSTITHIREGNVLRQASVWMGGGGVFGAILGALIAVEVPGPILARIWGAFLLFTAYRLASQALRAQKGKAVG
ncbi:MAG TPA: sulfite exporter TauE/SafE family protein [Candidatus Acidoferrum sp.]|nr:sulfite exporter TauE/SafE family protein [Candidatus Acidoferrum sp.]